MSTPLERFIACMEYQPCDRRPNHELGVWPQTADRWRKEAPNTVCNFTWDWFTRETALNLDRREYIPVNYGFIPEYQNKVLEETDEYKIILHSKGYISKALKGGACMDQYLKFPVETPGDFADVKRRLVSGIPERYPADIDAQIEEWLKRDYPLVLGRNCAANGFYWRAREFMGTENLSYAWYDYPELMHQMMEFFADFIIETSRPVLKKINVEYFVLNEDMSMKNGPLLSPETFRTFIFPHLVRLIDFLKSHGTRYVMVDSDGDPTQLIPLLMDAGVDGIWPIERASGISPQELRRKFGPSLRLWGGVDKRILSMSPDAIRAHLREFIPLIEQGGFIPTVDHTVPPDVSWDQFRIYMEAKEALLSGDFFALER